MSKIDDFLTAITLSRSKGGDDFTWKDLLDDLSDTDLARIRQGVINSGSSRSHLIHDAVRTVWGATLSEKDDTVRRLKENLMPSPKPRVPADKYDLFVGAGRAGETANVPDSLAQMIGGRSRTHLIKAVKRLDKASGVTTSTAGMTKTQLVNRLLTRMDQMTDTRAIPKGGSPAASMRGAGSYVRGQRTAGRSRALPQGDPLDINAALGNEPDLPDMPPRRETGLTRRGGPIVPFDGGADDDVVDAVFSETRKRGRAPGPSTGPIYAEAAPTRRALPAASSRATTNQIGKIGGAASKLGKFARVGKFLGPAAVAVAAADVAMRVMDASSGNIDRQRLHRGEIGNDLINNVGFGLEEINTEAQGQAISSIANTGQALDTAAALGVPEQQANELENLLVRRRAELAGVGIRSQPSEDEYRLAMRRFM